MSDNICILITGVENLTGVDAIQMQEYFKLKKYPSNHVAYYIDVESKISELGNAISPAGNLMEFLSFLGMKGYIYRIDRGSNSRDTAIHFRMHIERLAKLKGDTIRIVMPIVRPYN